MSSYNMDRSDYISIGINLSLIQLGRDYNEKGFWILGGYMPAWEIVNRLAVANAKGVADRYNEAPIDLVPVLGKDIAAPIGCKPNPLALAGLLQTWDYQACDADDYSGSEAEKIYHALNEIILRELIKRANA